MTILGQHTVAEARDLLRATEFRVNKNIQQLDKVRAARPRQPSSPEQVRLDADMSIFVKRWVETRDKQALLLAASIASNPMVSPSVLPAETNYVAIVKASTRDDPRLVFIEQRIDVEAKQLNLAPTNLAGMPSQNSPDADFAGLRKLDAAIAAGEKAAAEAAAAAKKAAKSNIGLLLGLGAVGVLGTVVAVKIYL